MESFLILEILKALNSMLLLDFSRQKSLPAVKNVKMIFDECGGTGVLEQVQFHTEQEVFDSVSLIISAYFSEDVTRTHDMDVSEDMVGSNQRGFLI
jgi:hypothetical protein